MDSLTCCFAGTLIDERDMTCGKAATMVAVQGHTRPLCAGHLQAVETIDPDTQEVVVTESHVSVRPR